MRILKWLAFATAVIAVVAIVVHLRRDAIARGIANSILDEQEFRVTELSVDTLATDRLELSNLVIESLSGARYEVRGLSLPLGGAASKHEPISAQRLIVSYERKRDLQTMLSTTLQAVLDLPSVRPGIDVTIERVSLPGLPDLTQLAWGTSDTGQELAFVIDAIRVATGAQRHDDRTHRISIDAIHNDRDQVFSAAVELQRAGKKYTANGRVSIRTAAWLPFFKSMNLLPASLTSFDAEFRGPIEVLLDDTVAGHAVFNAQLELPGDFKASFQTAESQAIDVLVTSQEPFSLHAQYPSFDWLLQVDKLLATLDNDVLQQLPLRAEQIECRSGIRCTLQAYIDVDNLQWNGYEFDSVAVHMPVVVESDDQIRVDISPDSTGLFTGVRTSGIVAANIKVDTFTGTQLVIADDAWHCHIDELKLFVHDISGVQKLIASAPLAFRDVTIRDSARNVATQFSVPSDIDANWNDVPLVLPGVSGTLSIRDERLSSSFELSDSRNAISGDVDVDLSLSDDSGSLVVNNPQLSFDRANLSEFVPGWPHPWDIVAGSWDGKLDIQWRPDGQTTTYSGKMTHKLDGLAGKFNDIAFRGLSTELTATLESSTGIDVMPSSIVIRLLDVGMPLEHIVAEYAIDAKEQTVDIQNLSVAALGGKFVADPFRLSTTAQTNLVMLHAESVQLQLMLDLAEFEAVEMTGAISGELPVAIGRDNITIEDGRLESDPPGGVIRYKADDGGLEAAAPDSNLGVVTQALSNFEYSSLSSDVDYTEAGDLKLQMRLSGINPDVDATQPVILNLGVENNVPQLLRSLRAIRSIEDILEQRTDD